MAFFLYFKDGGSFQGALPFAIALALAFSIVTGGFVYWLVLPVDRLPLLDTKGQAPDEHGAKQIFFTILAAVVPSQ